MNRLPTVLPLLNRVCKQGVVCLAVVLLGNSIELLFKLLGHNVVLLDMVPHRLTNLFLSSDIAVFLFEILFNGLL